MKKGYIKDDYVHLFVRRPVRRSPIINRGRVDLITVLNLWLSVGDRVICLWLELV